VLTCKLQLPEPKRTKLPTIPKASRRNFEQVPAVLPATGTEAAMRNLHLLDSAACQTTSGRSKAAPPARLAVARVSCCATAIRILQHPLMIMIIQTGSNRCHETIIMPLTILPNVSEKLLKLFHPPQSFPLNLAQRRVHHGLPANHSRAMDRALHFYGRPCPVRALSPRSCRWEPSIELARTSPCSMTS
jgi:hypothetical protein